MNIEEPNTDVVHVHRCITGTGRQRLSIGVVTVTDDQGTTHPTVLEIVGEIDLTDLEQVDEVLDALTLARDHFRQVRR